ncbi:MAG: hypothetical protein J0I42_12190 [Bosea sp.]|uniref:hypothetical protein n=1 Tax=Bosea sp. (in: a-proteobacteria) TaxID=1871050 RepID=UPI001AD5D77C|nr:hypothetical protein [Bosea sp. (in: a-proteobacteria)]MBN9452699.1 hypothetical protein [Bosea sp. (in: a-proteobacteria)]
MAGHSEEQLAAVQREAAAFVKDELRRIETAYGLAAATAAAQGMTAAMVQWSEDATGMTIQEALQHPLNKHGRG